MSQSHPLVLGCFLNSLLAESAVLHLLASGVRGDDISLLIPGQDQADALDELATAVVLSTRQPRASDSPIGGGISTASADDDVSTVDEMDDSQAFAEDMSYEETESWVSGEGEVGEDRVPEAVITEQVAPRFGRLIGEGTFAAALLSAAYDSDPPTLGEVLRAFGFGPSVSVACPILIAETGSLLVVDAIATGPSADTLARILVDSGASYWETLPAPVSA